MTIEQPAGEPQAGGRWALAAHVYAAVTALGLGYFIAASPLQVSENLRNLMAVQRSSLWQLLTEDLTAGGFLRPLILAPIDVAFELSGGHYYTVFKVIHVLQVMAAAALFVRLLRVHSLPTLLAVPFGMAMLLGNHTFAGTVTEGFPINTFLTIVVCCLAAAALADGKPSSWRDGAAVVLFVFAALTVESGLLVWVIFVSAWLAGLRGVSGRGVTFVTAGVAAYLLVRFGLLSTGAPGLIERSSGYGFRVLDPPELIERFGANPIWFYAYNVVTQVASVLFGEPKAGVFVLARSITAGEVLPRDVIAVCSSTAATLLVGVFAIVHVSGWRRHGLDRAGAWIAVAVAVIGANAAISYPYTKAVIVSPAGTFHALAATLAFGWALQFVADRSRRERAAAVALALVVLSTGWTVRLVGIHYRLREKAFLARNDWSEVVIGQPPADFDAARYPDAVALVQQLRTEAIAKRVENPSFDPSWPGEYFEEAW